MIMSEGDNNMKYQPMWRDEERCGERVEICCDVERCDNNVKSEIPTNVKRCGEMLRDVERCGKMWSDLKRTGEMWSDVEICCDVERCMTIM